MAQARTTRAGDRPGAIDQAQRGMAVNPGVCSLAALRVTLLVTYDPNARSRFDRLMEFEWELRR